MINISILEYPILGVQAPVVIISLQHRLKWFKICKTETTVMKPASNYPNSDITLQIWIKR